MYPGLGETPGEAFRRGSAAIAEAERQIVRDTLTQLERNAGMLPGFPPPPPIPPIPGRSPIAVELPDIQVKSTPWWLLALLLGVFLLNPRVPASQLRDY